MGGKSRAFWTIVGYVMLAWGTAPAKSSTVASLNAPTNLQGTATSTSSITWTWNPATGATVIFQELHDESHQLIATLSSSTIGYTEPGLSENTQYTRHIHAVGLAGC